MSYIRELDAQKEPADDDSYFYRRTDDEWPPAFPSGKRQRKRYGKHLDENMIQNGQRRRRINIVQKNACYYRDPTIHVSVLLEYLLRDLMMVADFPWKKYEGVETMPDPQDSPDPVLAQIRPLSGADGDNEPCTGADMMSAVKCRDLSTGLPSAEVAKFRVSTSDAQYG